MITNRLTLSHAMQDHEVSQRLLQIARKHLKLALEHGHINTTKERRESIRNEISNLRIERDELLLPFDEGRVSNE